MNLTKGSFDYAIENDEGNCAVQCYVRYYDRNDAKKSCQSMAVLECINISFIDEIKLGLSDYDYNTNKRFFGLTKSSSYE